MNKNFLSTNKQFFETIYGLQSSLQLSDGHGIKATSLLVTVPVS